MTIVKEQIIKVQKVFWHLLCIFWVFLDLRCCWKQNFQKEQGNLSSEGKTLTYIFSYYRAGQTSRNDL